MSNAERAFTAVRRLWSAGAGWLWVITPPYRGGRFLAHPLRPRKGAKSGALENATVCRLNFADAKFTPPNGGVVWLTPNDGKP